MITSPACIVIYLAQDVCVSRCNTNIGLACTLLGAILTPLQRQIAWKVIEVPTAAPCQKENQKEGHSLCLSFTRALSSLNRVTHWNKASSSVDSRHPWRQGPLLCKHGQQSKDVLLCPGPIQELRPVQVPSKLPCQTFHLKKAPL